MQIRFMSTHHLAAGAVNLARTAPAVKIFMCLTLAREAGKVPAHVISQGKTVCSRYPGMTLTAEAAIEEIRHNTRTLPDSLLEST